MSEPAFTATLVACFAVSVALIFAGMRYAERHNYSLARRRFMVLAAAAVPLMPVSQFLIFGLTWNVLLWTLAMLPLQGVGLVATYFFYEFIVFKPIEWVWRRLRGASITNRSVGQD